MNRAFLLPLVCVFGCIYGPIGPQPNGDDPAPGSTSTGSSSTGNTPTTSTSSESSSGDPEPPPPILTGTDGSSSTGTTEPEVNFIAEDDYPKPECDPFNQDECPRGTKCTWYADDGGSSWNNTKCVPVMEDPAQVGEPCFVVGNGISGVDNCDVGMMCWDTDAENIGYCVAFCVGSPDSPLCEQAGFTCVGGRSLSICLAGCDPLIQNCPMEDDLCIPSDSGFLCVLDASGDEGQLNDPCMFANACDKGLYCVDPANGAECDQATMGCCQPFCDLAVMNPDAACTGDGQTCVPWYEAGTAPPGYEFVGICAIAP